jgi:hypothetical protein
MIYCRIPQYDISISKTEKRGLACFMCSFGDFIESHYFAPSTEEMVAHIEAHERVGAVIPQDLKERLLEDDSVNYSEPSS